jgi:hypothetical protein
MEKMKEMMRKSTLVLTSGILLSFALAAMSAVIDSLYLVYFWYLGLIGIGLLIILSLLGGLILFFNNCCNLVVRWKRVWNGTPVGLP